MFGDPVTNPKGWDIKQLGECGSFKNGMNYSQNDNGFEIKCLGVGDFKDRYKIDNINEISEINLSSEPTQEYLLKNGDIVFVRSNGNKELVGRSVEVFPNNVKLTFSGFCIRYRNSNENLLTVYLNHALHLPSTKGELLNDGRGANIQNVNQQALSLLKIPLPPLKLQTQFAEFVRQVDKSEFALQKTLGKLNNNFHLKSQPQKKASIINSSDCCVMERYFK
jgi:type I restriction enzyme S subunit